MLMKKCNLELMNHLRAIGICEKVLEELCKSGVSAVPLFQNKVGHFKEQHIVLLYSNFLVFTIPILGW